MLLQAEISQVRVSKHGSFSPILGEPGSILKMYLLFLSHVSLSGKPYLGYVDKIGVSFTDKSVATGFGSYIAQPMMRKAMEG